MDITELTYLFHISTFHNCCEKPLFFSKIKILMWWWYLHEFGYNPELAAFTHTELLNFIRKNSPTETTRKLCNFKKQTEDTVLIRDAPDQAQGCLEHATKYVPERRRDRSKELHQPPHTSAGPRKQWVKLAEHGQHRGLRGMERDVVDGTDRGRKLKTWPGTSTYVGSWPHSQAAWASPGLLSFAPHSRNGAAAALPRVIFRLTRVCAAVAHSLH